MKWTTKATIQRALSAVPAGSSIYYLGQRCIGSFRHFNVDSKVRQGNSLLECLSALGEDMSGWRSVEIGTGWTPIVPLLFWAHGQAACDTYDVTPLLRKKLLAKTIEQLGQSPETASARHVPSERLAQVAERLSHLRQRLAEGAEPERLLRECHVRYHPASDAAHTDLPDGSVDLVFSNVVLEHVPLPEVHRLFRETYRILRPNGYMVHLIDPSDHFSHSDRSLSPVNFLQFSDDQFAKYNSSFMFQNRMRASTWRDLIEQHRFEISHWRALVNDDALRRLPSLPVDPSFQHLAAEDLCTTAIWVAARRPASS